MPRWWNSRTTNGESSRHRRRWQPAPRDPGLVGDLFWVANQGNATVSVIDPVAGEVVDTLLLADAAGIFVAEGLLGDGRVLDFGGRDVFRITAIDAAV